MPLYEYQCQACGGRFERIRKFSDPPLDEPCPACGGKVEKLISSPAFQFKGSGWYVTDYAKSGSESKPESKAEGSPESKKKDSSEGKSESTSSTETPSKTKTETKSELKPAPAAPAKSD